jgi:hypothetical protein
MAKRILNRRELRIHADQAEHAEPANGAPEVEPAAKKRKAKAATAPRTRKSRPKKAPPRMRARWGVFDGSMKQVAIFDYNDRAGAEQKLADLREKKKTVHFMQIVKEPMPEPVTAEAITD